MPRRRAASPPSTFMWRRAWAMPWACSMTPRRPARRGALAELVALAEAIGAPVHLEGMDNAAPFPSSHPLFRGPITRLAPQIRTTLAPHDLLLSVGGDLLTMSLPSEIEAMPPDLP